MMQKIKTVLPHLPNHKFEAAIDLTTVAFVFNNGGVWNLTLESGKEIQIEATGNFHDFVDKVTMAKVRRNPHG